MALDWGPVVVSLVLFILLSPGLLFQLPARTRIVEFATCQPVCVSILVHSIIYLCSVIILLIAVGIHIHAN
ncbi:hypothetical protein MKW92_013517 [Papaver armeniacum]|nr:hypothetical protein MKW92_013517 [Papaver armeniacum]